MHPSLGTEAGPSLERDAKEGNSDGMRLADAIEA
jgi:hypothetical protein